MKSINKRMTQPKNILFDSLNVIACVKPAVYIPLDTQRKNSCKQTMKMQRVLFGASMLLFWVAMNIHCIPPPYPGQSDLTSGSLIAAAGSIGIVALAASAALAAMSSSKISKDCNCKNTTPEPVTEPVTEPGPLCEVLLEEERQRCGQEKELFGRTIRGNCEELVSDIFQDCVQCLEFFDDETACNERAICSFDEIRGVCVSSDGN
ncbi:uncharacterized protein LOC128164489 [Crassostrea angulata]|uniref:uncharacterized protein LOC128164489 n=1 Tax=Magallana angulata TaxID=2784310 RepID=UPI0022B191AB|nr:uncharacterized protein LOC128164489 [Crassostrea angulata]